MHLIVWHSFLAPIYPLVGVETPVDIHWMTINTSDHKYSGRGEKLPTPKWHQHLFVQLCPASPTYAGIQSMSASLSKFILKNQPDDASTLLPSTVQN